MRSKYIFFDPTCSTRDSKFQLFVHYWDTPAKEAKKKKMFPEHVHM